MIQAAPPAQDPIYQGLQERPIPLRVHLSTTGIGFHQGVKGAPALIQGIQYDPCIFSYIKGHDKYEIGPKFGFACLCF